MVTTQPNLFSPWADTRTTQKPLFDPNQPPPLPHRCPRCRQHLVTTDSGYATCPAGCLRLLIDADDILSLPTPAPGPPNPVNEPTAKAKRAKPARRKPDPDCPECQRSYGPHYRGPCNH